MSAGCQSSVSRLLLSTPFPAFMPILSTEPENTKCFVRRLNEPNESGLCPESVETLGSSSQMSRRSEPEKTSSTVLSPTAERAAFISRLQAILRQWPSADRLARATGVSPSAFRKWLRGEAEPSRERLVALAQAAGVGVGWLAGGEGPEPRLHGLAETQAALSMAGGFGEGDYLLLPK